MATTTTPIHIPFHSSKSDHISARPPQSKLGLFIWRRRMWFESTFVLSMLEPWEKFLLLTMFIVLFVLVLAGLFKYLPHHLVVMQSRAVYYLWGQEGDDRIIWQLLGLGTENGFGLQKEL